MPQRVSEISCFSNFDIACMQALRQLGWHTGSMNDPKLHTDGREFAHFVENYMRRPMIRSGYQIVKVAHVEKRRHEVE